MSLGEATVWVNIEVYIQKKGVRMHPLLSAEAVGVLFFYNADFVGKVGYVECHGVGACSGSEEVGAVE